METTTNPRIVSRESQIRSLNEEIAAIRQDLLTREATPEFQAAKSLHEKGYDLIDHNDRDFGAQTALYQSGVEAYRWDAGFEMLECDFNEIYRIFDTSSTKEFLAKMLTHLHNLSQENLDRFNSLSDESWQKIPKAYED